ncbi:MAG TPA: hypothetical protein VN659_12915, partial [Pyrinomonadaceae bacterium]|nr:hypothetical protein [Pyrinomonadaceae bacterium]
MHCCRQILAVGLVLFVFLPTLVLNVSAYAPIDTASENDHFLLYQNQYGETVCREATLAEGRELDKIKPTGLRP